MALEHLASQGDYEDRLVEVVLKTDGCEALSEFYYYLHHLSRSRLLWRSVHLNGDRIATLAPISFYFEYNFRNIRRECQYVLSRFAYTRAMEGETILECALSHARLILHDSRVAKLVYALARPNRMVELARRGINISANAADQLMTLMLNAEMLTEVTNCGTSVDDEKTSLKSWEFHDLLFHSRSREGRHDYAVGGTYRLLDELDPPPALKTAASDNAVPLYCPDLERRKREDPPFALVQEVRHSIREYDKTPINDQQLGEFLHRVGRVTDYTLFEMQTPRGPVRMECAHRPYPSGGALYELELYLAVNACENVPAGLYHYDAPRHRLEHLSDLGQHAGGLLVKASYATGIPVEELQVLIIISARFQRMSWKYASMAYAATLKNVGVLYQTMYLVATAMELAPCAIGSGDADLFARATGINYYDETSVGEFLLGSRRSDPVSKTHSPVGNVR
jgi:SagB-type dehydrogenase family enzyme